jgi:hypothetical protein
VNEEPLLTREELTATLFAIHDIRDDLRTLVWLTEEDDGEEGLEADA